MYPLLSIFLNVLLILTLLFVAGMYLAAYPVPLGWANYVVYFLLFAAPLGYLLYCYLPVYFSPPTSLKIAVNGLWVVYFLAYFTFVTLNEKQNFTYKKGFRVKEASAKEISNYPNNILVGFTDGLIPQTESTEIRIIKGKYTRKEYLTPLLWPQQDVRKDPVAFYLLHNGLAFNATSQPYKAISARLRGLPAGIIEREMMKNIAQKHGLPPANEPVMVEELYQLSLKEIIAQAPIDYYYVFGFVYVLWACVVLAAIFWPLK